MKGLIYKENIMFFKGIDKKLLLIMVGAIILLMVNIGAHAGMIASIMLSMTIGIQNTMSFSVDEKADWKKYQLAMPVNAISVVTSKYISVICTLAVSLAGSMLLNLLYGIAFRSFDIIVWKVSASTAVLIPLLWASIHLPFNYWFGFRSAQVMGILAVVPVFYFVKYFEDGAGFPAMANAILSYAAFAGIAVIALFIVSMIISMIGYNRKK